MKTDILSPSHQGLNQAAKILSGGGLVAFPTETVYGLGADARNDEAVAKIFKAKNRPSFNPLIVHVPHLDMAQDFASFPAPALTLANHFWPGGLTLVVPLRRGGALAPLVTAGLSHVGLRVPKSKIARDLLIAFNGPIAAPSANPSGAISPTCAQHVIKGLSGKIDAILDGEISEIGVESTIISFEDGPTLLRPGGISCEDIEACLQSPLKQHNPSSILTAPGQMTSHYAPKARLRMNAAAPKDDEVLLGFGPVLNAALNLSPSGDLTEAAANLFRHLHALDAKDGKNIAVSPIPAHGLGRAINDRLKRAAAPRP